ncbi:MAG: DUF3987 domain-containing protein, partial [Rhizobiales bacterium]|nr:DUF3987 domain-containing protein [Hyphomicrobiales bacterium]
PYILETSAGNQQAIYIFSEPLTPAEAKPLAEALTNAIGCDYGTKDVCHVWRIPGTLNWPNKKKVVAGRSAIPQLVRVSREWAIDVIQPSDLDERVKQFSRRSPEPVQADHAHRSVTQSDVAELFSNCRAGLRKLIAAPAYDGEDRSETAASVIWQLMSAGYADQQIVAVIEAHPGGIGARYAEGKDLPADVTRIRRDWTAKRSAATQTHGIWDPWEKAGVPDFPLDVLPSGIQPFVQTQSAVLGCDPSALAMAALVNFSAALDHRFGLKLMRNGDWWASPRLWVLLLGDPSRKKTPLINAATRELERHQNRLRDEYEAAFKRHLEADGDPKDGPAKPARFVVNDTTTEMLGEILSRHDRGILVKRDEFSGWIGSMERYGAKGGSDRAFWLQAFDGGTFMVDRVSRGEIRIRNLSVSLMGGIQPAKLAEMHGLTSDGLLQRFIPVIMGPSRFPQDVPVNEPFRDYERITRTLINAPAAKMRCADDALDVMDDLRRHLFDVEQVSEGLAEGFQAFIGKLPGLAGSLALVLHMATNPRDGGVRPVSRSTAMAVQRIVRDFILPHALEFYRTAETLTDGDRIQKVASYILTSGASRLLVSDLTRNVAQFRGLGMKEVNDRLSPLVAGGWLTPNDPGPITRSWTVNPAVFSQLKKRAEEEDRRKQALADLLNGPRRGR